MPYRLSLFVNDLSPPNKEKLTSTVTGLTKLRCFMLQVASALAPSAWGNQLHLFALSLALCRPIFCYSSFLINSSTSNAVQQWAAGYCGTINELCQAFAQQGPQTFGSKLYLGRAEHAHNRPLALLLSREHFTAILARTESDMEKMPRPHSTVVQTLS